MGGLTALLVGVETCPLCRSRNYQHPVASNTFDAVYGSVDSLVNKQCSVALHISPAHHVFFIHVNIILKQS